MIAVKNSRANRRFSPEKGIKFGNFFGEEHGNNLPNNFFSKNACNHYMWC